jgi:hypothetical protein
MSTLGTLGFHLEGNPCRVGCSFCYLGDRVGNAAGDRSLAPEVIRAVIARASARDVAVAVSEPARRWRSGLTAVVDAARSRDLPVAVTTTAAVVTSDPWILEGVSRLSISIDPAKDRTSHLDLAYLEQALAITSARTPAPEVIGLVSLASPEFCALLADGLLERILDLPGIAAVALNGIKPPPPWCDRRFWLKFLGRIRPLLDRHLNRRLHLDCYVNARILGLSACPARADVSPGREFRSCVYQARPDFVFTDGEDLARRTADYVAPAVCPFAIV